MYDYSNTGNPLCEPSPEAVSPDRPPQLNQTICGCRCGRGSGGLGGEGGNGKNDEDAAQTLVASETSDSDGAATLSPDNEHAQMNFDVVRQPHSPGNEQTDEVGTKFSSSVQSFGLSPHVIGFEELPARPLPHQDYDVTSDSLQSERCGSDDHRVMSERPRIRPISPGPGIGAWIEGNWAEGVQLEYHFLGRPLRLSPQHRHCRGLVASHLVLRDQMSYMYLLDEE